MVPFGSVGWVDVDRLLHVQSQAHDLLAARSTVAWIPAGSLCSGARINNPSSHCLPRSPSPASLRSIDVRVGFGPDSALLSTVHRRRPGLTLACARAYAWSNHPNIRSSSWGLWFASESARPSGLYPCSCHVRLSPVACRLSPVA